MPKDDAAADQGDASYHQRYTQSSHFVSHGSVHGPADSYEQANKASDGHPDKKALHRVHHDPPGDRPD
jgi:hypothetical protein